MFFLVGGQWGGCFSGCEGMVVFGTIQKRRANQF